MQIKLTATDTSASLVWEVLCFYSFIVGINANFM